MKRMQVHVKLYSRLRDQLPPEARGEATIELRHRATVDELLDQLGVTRRVKVINVNGRQETNRDHVLNHGDRVRIFPFVVGG